MTCRRKGRCSDLSSSISSCHARLFRELHDGYEVSEILGFRMGYQGLDPGRALEPFRGRGRIARCLKDAMGHRKASTVELASDVDRKAAVPIFRRDLLHRSRRAGDTSVVNQRIKPAKSHQCFIEEAGDLNAICHVGQARCDFRISPTKFCKLSLIHIAHVYRFAFTDKCTCNLATYAIGSCRDEDTG